MNDGIVRLSVFSDDLLDCFFSFKIPIMFAFNENIPNVSSLDWFLRDLYFGTRVLLELSDSLSLLSND